MIADVEIRPGLRGGQREFVADAQIANADGQQNEGEAGANMPAPMNPFRTAPPPRRSTSQPASTTANATHSRAKGEEGR
jgi:hypothetical protein